MKIKIFVLFFILILLISCISYQSPNKKSNTTKSNSNTSIVLSLWGDYNYNVFLGHINVSRFNNNSIWNEVGKYGSEFSSYSIWSQFGDYGSKFSNFSPWNEFATKPPGIFDKNGTFYGYFTINDFFPNRTNIEFCVWILDNYEYVFENLDKIRDDF